MHRFVDSTIAEIVRFQFDERFKIQRNSCKETCRRAMFGLGSKPKGIELKCSLRVHQTSCRIVYVWGPVHWHDDGILPRIAIILIVCLCHQLLQSTWLPYMFVDYAHASSDSPDDAICRMDILGNNLIALNACSGQNEFYVSIWSTFSLSVVSCASHTRVHAQHLLATQ